MKALVVRTARPGDPAPFDTVALSWDERTLRRRRLECRHGEVLVDLAEVTCLEHGARLVLADGRHVEVIAADEDLAEVTGPAIARLAWHLGNRHTSCQVEPHRLLIRRDHVLEDMLRGLGATIRHVSEPFRPEGGAYGNGRSHAHDHSHG